MPSVLMTCPMYLNTIVPRLAGGGVALVDRLRTQYCTREVAVGFENWLKMLALLAKAPPLKIRSSANCPPRKLEPKPFLWETTDLKNPLDFVDEEEDDDFVEELLPEEVLGPD